MPKVVPDSKHDIPVWELQILSWGTPDEARESLIVLYSRVIEKTADSIHWYLKKARTKRIGARILRLVVIAMVTLTGLMPLLSQLIKDSVGSLIIAPGWASVPMVLAAAMIGLDKFFGCSAGWVRFISAGLKLQKILSDFQIDWQTGTAGWKQKNAPSPDEILSMLSRAKTLLSQVDDVVLDETNAWIAEFTSVLKMMEESAKAQAEAAKPGGLNIKVMNGDQAQNGWYLSIDSRQETKCSGTSAAAGSLAPGIHTVSVRGEIAGNPKQAAKAVMIVSNAVEDVDLPLA
jgi:hypothetical protein